MLRHFQRLVFALAVAVVTKSALAISFSGPPDTWQTQDIGYQIDAGDIFGPMNLGEEYRWSIPVVTYGFDSSFLDYFGQEGVNAVEEAIALLNALPAASSMSPGLAEYQLDTRRFNYQASALNLLDLKSFALSGLLEEMGLASPERYVWTLRSRVVINNIPRYTTIKRSFDPVSLVPSSYVNGTLYTYIIAQTFANPDVWEAVEETVDPAAPSITAVASLIDLGIGDSDLRGEATLFSPGLFYTGLTRDDVGAIRYIYTKNNLNVENLPPNSTLSNGGGSPWGFPGGTNGVPVGQALRPGVDKLTFMRVNFDSLLGQFVPTTNIYTDTFYTNGAAQHQTIQRILLAPDITFSAQDLGVTVGGIPVRYGRSLSRQNNNGINGSTGGGPGQITTGVSIAFSNAGPWFRNIPEGDEENAAIGFAWGSFNGTTNAPIAFPNGTSIRALEQLVFGSGGSSPWTVP